MVPAWSAAKLRFAVPLVRRLKDYFDPQWGNRTPDFDGVAADRAGTAQPPRVRQHGLQAGELHLRQRLPGALAAREPEPRRRTTGYAASSPTCRSRSSARWPAAWPAGGWSPTSRSPGLPDDYTAEPPRTSARFVFLTGERSRCFLPESQVRTHAYLSRSARVSTRAPSTARVQPPGRVHREVGRGGRLPLILRELEQPAG